LSDKGRDYGVNLKILFLFHPDFFAATIEKSAFLSSAFLREKRREGTNIKGNCKKYPTTALKVIFIS
jgi:hypothetical protein